MKFYFAPMEGITGYVFRNAHHACFPSVDRYYTPFISPNQNRPMSPKEKRDVLPENNRNIPLIPQILTNNATQFLQATKVLADMGYEEVRLVDTAQEAFGSHRRAAMMMLGSSRLLVGRK